MKRSTALLLAGGFLAVSAVAYRSSIVKAYDINAIVTKPPAKVSVIVTCWEESMEYVQTSLTSLRDSNIMKAYPDSFEVITIGCQGTDMKLAAQYSDLTACAPKGKLFARELGMKMATGEIIVAMDCDVFVPPNSLNLLLQPFQDPNVIAVAGSGVNDIPIVDIITQYPRWLYEGLKLRGRFSAYYKWAYYATGGWDLTINQQNAGAMVYEEEIKLYQKLQKFGKIPYVDTMVRHIPTDFAVLAGTRKGGLRT